MRLFIIFIANKAFQTCKMLVYLRTQEQLRRRKNQERLFECYVSQQMTSWERCPGWVIVPDPVGTSLFQEYLMVYSPCYFIGYCHHCFAAPPLNADTTLIVRIGTRLAATNTAIHTERKRQEIGIILLNCDGHIPRILRPFRRNFHLGVHESGTWTWSPWIKLTEESKWLF